MSTDPVIVTVSSTAGAGGSGPVVPTGRRPIVLQVLTPLVIISVRAARVFLQGLLGAMTAGNLVASTNLLPAQVSAYLHDFGNLMLVSACSALGATVVCIIQNLIELLTKFDQSHPTLSV